jgi:thiamine kinase-like enzyme
MEKHRIKEYIDRWLSVQSLEDKEKVRIRESFERRQDEPHVEALARNPMQLSVLLQFIRLKGEAFPDRRAELYRDYFQIVIDRDVEKSPDLSEYRNIIQTLHGFIGYKIHTLTEVNQADRTLERKRLLKMAEKWLKASGYESEMAQRFFKLGEERFGLIVASKWLCYSTNPRVFCSRFYL